MWGGDPRANVQAGEALLTPAPLGADGVPMWTSLLYRAVASGEYQVNPDAVADAILRRMREDDEVPMVPSQVLVPAHLFEDLPGGPDEVHAVAVDNVP